MAIGRPLDLSGFRQGLKDASYVEDSSDHLVCDGEQVTGIETPRILAVLSFITSSNLVGLDRKVSWNHAFENLIDIAWPALLHRPLRNGQCSIVVGGIRFSGRRVHENPR
jgi:hypothetical protein